MDAVTRLSTSRADGSSQRLRGCVELSLLLFALAAFAGLTKASAAPAAPLTVPATESLAKVALAKHDANALSQLRSAAAVGQANAQYGMALYDYSAMMFFDPDPTSGKGIASAMQWLTKAADQGLPQAQYRLCLMLERNIAGVVNYDPKAARPWCERAAAAGNVQAAYQLALQGLPVTLGGFQSPGDVQADVPPELPEADRVQTAIHWLRVAAEGGIESAQMQLARVYAAGGYVPENSTKSAYWALQAAGNAQVGTPEDPWSGRWIHPAWEEKYEGKALKQCRALASVPIPAQDLPPAAAIPGLMNCNSENAYYGIGEERNFERARWCAYLERPGLANGNGWGAPAFAGPSILMMLYANGHDVHQDFRLAEKFACEMGGAPAELKGRLAHLKAMASGQTTKSIDACDDVTSGLMGGLCALRDGQIAKEARSARLAVVEASLAPAARTSFRALVDAAHLFAGAQSQGEVDQTGTARVALIEGQQQKDLDAFEALLQSALAKRLSYAEASQVESDRAALNQEYKRVVNFRGLRADAQPFPFGTVHADGIRSAQDAWRAYYAAWGAFARVSQLQADAISLALVKERKRQLDSFIQACNWSPAAKATCR